MVRRILLKLEMPPLGMELRTVARPMSQMRMSRKDSKTWERLTREFWVPLGNDVNGRSLKEGGFYLWLSFTLMRTATFSASVNLLALTGESGKYIATKTPTIMVIPPIAM